MKNLIRHLSKGFLTIVFIGILQLVFSCSDENEELGTYYENSFQDQLSFSTQEDTINIIMEQYKNYFKIKETIPFSIIENQSIDDSIFIVLFVSFGSYNQYPTVYKNVTNINDSIIVYYSSLKNYAKVLDKSSEVNSTTTSPRIAYTSVDSVVISKPQSKTVYFSSQFVK